MCGFGGVGSSDPLSQVKVIQFELPKNRPRNPPWKKNNHFDPHEKKSLVRIPSARSPYLPLDPSRKIYVNAELLFYYIKGR